MKVCRPILPVKLAAMTMSLDRPQNESENLSSASSPEIFEKIGLVVSEIM